MTATFSIEEYAAALLGPGPDGTADTVESHKVEWLSLRLRGRANPKLPGYKAGRKWRATQADVEAAIELLRPQTVEVPRVPQLGGLTKTSRRRLAG